MPKRPSRPRSAEDFAGGPNYEREFIRPGPDYADLGENTADGFAPHGSRSSVPHDRGVPTSLGAVPRPNYPFADVASAARRGRFFGRGPKGYRRSDARIREEICDRLMTHPDIDASDMELSVDNGIVTLNGTVEDRHEKRLAEYIAEDALGVDDVDNRLKVRSGFWATIIGERAMERELPTRAERETQTLSKERGRATAARNAARREADAR